MLLGGEVGATPLGGRVGCGVGFMLSTDVDEVAGVGLGDPDVSCEEVDGVGLGVPELGPDVEGVSVGEGLGEGLACAEDEGPAVVENLNVV
jgi:hypothetical protein